MNKVNIVAETHCIAVLSGTFLKFSSQKLSINFVPCRNVVHVYNCDGCNRTVLEADIKGSTKV